MMENIYSIGMYKAGPVDIRSLKITEKNSQHPHDKKS